MSEDQEEVVVAMEPIHLSPKGRTLPPSHSLNHEAAAASSANNVEEVRPESLRLASPLAQLTRSLSISRDRKEGSETAQRHTGHTAAVDREEAARLCTSPGTESLPTRHLAVGNTTHLSPSPPAGPSSRDNSSFLELSENEDTPRYTLWNGPTDEQAARSSNETIRSATSSTSSSCHNTQIINAFRNSYSTHLTGGMRDSSYSWLLSDPDSPGPNMAFQQVAAAQGISSSSAADASHLGTARHPYQQDADTSLTAMHINWEETDRAKVRRSSWDSVDAASMNLRRLPSDATTHSRSGPASNNQGETRPRGSAISASDPFHYAVGSLECRLCLVYPAETVCITVLRICAHVKWRSSSYK